MPRITIDLTDDDINGLMAAHERNIDIIGDDEQTAKALERELGTLRKILRACGVTM